MQFIIRVAPEIIIKSKPVRKKTIRLLAKNIEKHLVKYDGFFRVKSSWERIDISFVTDFPLEEILEILKNIPGIYSIAQVDEYIFETKEDIAKIVAPYAETKLIDGKTFCVRVRRSGEHDFSSTELERFLGGKIFHHTQKNLSVRLNNPDVEITLTVAHNALFLVRGMYYGIGGYPTGFQDKVLSLISGGFDSGVASYMSMKRGAKVDFLFFNLGGRAHELGVKYAAKYLWEKFEKPYNARFITVNFEPVVEQILQNTDNKYWAILLKRCMLRVASKFPYYALVKGDALGQVSSQTLENMHMIDEASDNLVLRPLIFMDKEDIMKISRQIGTYEMAASMPEYCGVVSKKPTAKGNKKIMLEEEEKLDMNVLDAVYRDKNIEKISALQFKEENMEKISVKQVAEKNDVIVDIRPKQEQEKIPLVTEGKEVILLPFHDIYRNIAIFQGDKNYLLYCEKGVLSELHGLYLQEKGLTNIFVYRPTS